jgi:phosphomannomutase
MYGVAKDIMLMCLASLRCYVDTINAYRDTMFGLNMPAPDKEFLGDMKFQMRNGDYDFGLATDGDSDRMALIDQNGDFIDPNNLLKLLYYYLKEYRGEKGGVVRNLTTTHILDRMADYYGEKHREVPVGFKHISQTKEEEDLLLGGESSGGLKIRGHINGKDGILAALLTVEMIAKTRKNISEILAEINSKFGYLYFTGINFSYDREEKLRLEKIIFEDKFKPEINKLKGISEKYIERISYQDGVKYYFDDQCWISIRFSGTEPLLRIYMEMKDEKEADLVCDFLKNELKINSI